MRWNPFSTGEREMVAAPEVHVVEAPREMLALPAGADVAPKATAAAGRDGTGTWWADLMTGGSDPNPDMQGRVKYETYAEMSTDPACRSLEWMFKLPVRSAEWTLVPPKNDPDGDAAARIRADFAAWNLGLEEHIGTMDVTWDEWTDETLTGMIRNGAHGEEVLWADPVEWTDADGDVHWTAPLARCAPRWVGTVRQISKDPRTGLITEVTQDIPGARPIPGDALAWYTFTRENHPWGVSLFRAAYGPWRLKKGLMVASAIGWDRHASGVPWIAHPPGEEQRAKELGRNLRVHERAYITTEEADPTNPLWDIKILGGNGTLMDPVPLLRHYDNQIAIAGMQQFSSLGTTERGSRAVGEVLSDPYYLAVQAIAKQLAQTRMKFVLRRLYDRNFGTHIPIPTLQPSKIQGRNIMVLGRALADMSSAGLNFADRDTQNDIRDILDLRHLPEQAADAIGQLPPDVGVEGTSIVPVG